MPVPRWGRRGARLVTGRLRTGRRSPAVGRRLMRLKVTSSLEVNSARPHAHREEAWPARVRHWWHFLPVVRSHVPGSSAGRSFHRGQPRHRQRGLCPRRRLGAPPGLQRGPGLGPDLRRTVDREPIRRLCRPTEPVLRVAAAFGFTPGAVRVMSRFAGSLRRLGHRRIGRGTREAGEVSGAGRRALRLRVPASFGTRFAGRGARTARSEPALPCALSGRAGIWPPRTSPSGLGRVAGAPFAAASHLRSGGHRVPLEPLPGVDALGGLLRPAGPAHPALGGLAPRTGWLAGRDLRSAGSRRRVDPRLGVDVHHSGVDEVWAGRRGAPVGVQIGREPPRTAGGGIGRLRRRTWLLGLVRIVFAGGHPHVPANGVGCVVSPDRVGSRYGWVLPGCGVAERPLPRLIHRRRLTVLP